MKETKMRWLATMHDPDGLPRAWGTARDPETAAAMAAHQLMLYRDKKNGIDPLAQADFVLKLQEYGEKLGEP